VHALIQNGILSCRQAGHDLGWAGLAEACCLPPAAVEQQNTGQSNKSFTYTTEEELGITLLFLSTGVSEQTLLRQIGSSPRTLWRIIKRVVCCLCTLGAPRYIYWPRTQEEWTEVADEFYAASRGRMYGAAGAIDNTHIDVKLSKDERMGAVDRNGQFTIHVQAVCTAGWRILSWRVGDAGSRQDSGVLQESQLWKAQEESSSPVIPQGLFLIGDAGFPCRTWLLTPWSQRQNGDVTPDQIRFNRIFCSQRVVIEQLFGIMKAQWQVLCHVRQYAQWHTLAAMRHYSMAAAVLHNVAIANGDVTPAQLFKKAQAIQHNTFEERLQSLLEKNRSTQSGLQSAVEHLSSSHRKRTEAGFKLLSTVTEEVLRRQG